MNENKFKMFAIIAYIYIYKQKEDEKQKRVKIFKTIL